MYLAPAVHIFTLIDTDIFLEKWLRLVLQLYQTVRVYGTYLGDALGESYARLLVVLRVTGHSKLMYAVMGD